jgi:peroxiredoxin
MDSVALGARVLLALVFAVAAAGKLVDQAGTREALRGFRLRERLLAPLALALPLAEALTAVALLVQPWARWGAVAALVLLAVFAAGIATAMARGEAPECHCFGQLHSAPAGPGTLIRNALLALPAVFVLAHGSGSRLSAWITGRSAEDTVALIVFAAAVGLAAYSLQLHRDKRRLSRDLRRVREATEAFPAGPAVGAPAPRFALDDVEGNAVTLDGLLARGKPIALVFVAADCGPCEDLLPSLADWQRRLAERLTIVIGGRGSARELRPMAESHGLQNVLADPDADLFESFRVSTTPSALIVSPDGMVGVGLHSTVAVVEATIRRALLDGATRAPRADDARPQPADGAPVRVVRVSGAPVRG